MDKKYLIIILMVLFGFVLFNAVSAETIVNDMPVSSIQLEDADVYLDVKLTDAQIKDLRSSSIHHGTYYGKLDKNSHYKIVDKKTKKYKTVYMTKSEYKHLKKYGTGYYNKKIPKDCHNIGTGYIKGDTSSGYYKPIKVLKKVNKKYKWYSHSFSDKKIGSKKAWVTKKIKTYETFYDSYGNYLGSKYWSPYAKYGYNIKYIRSQTKHYSDGSITWDYYKVKENKPIYKTVVKKVKHTRKEKFYKVKLQYVKHTYKYIKPKIKFKDNSNRLYYENYQWGDLCKGWITWK